MATDTASPATAAPTRLWQVPVFFLGMAAVVGVVLFQSYIVGLSPNNPERLLAEARSALASSPSDLETAIDRGQKLVARTELPSTILGEAHYLLGCAYLQSTDSNAPLQARHHLESAGQLGVPEADKPRLTIRLAKTWLAANVDPQQIIGALTRTADAADNPFEAYGLLIEAHQRVKPPDMTGLLEAARQQLSHAPPGMEPAKLAAARLRLAELLLEAKNIKEARIVLARNGNDAPAEMAFAARMMLAKTFEEAKEWPAATKVLEQACTDPKLPSGEKARALYRLGVAQVEALQPIEAAKSWQQAAALGGPAAQAAALRLAELRLATDPKAALAALADALKNVSKPEDYQNAAAALEDLRAVFERASEQLKARGDFETAVQLATLYAKVAAPGRAAELHGQMASSWAEILTREGRTELASAQWVAASRAFLAAAGAIPPSVEAANRYWVAAKAATQARDFALALEALDKFIPQHSFVTPESQAESWYTIGQVQENLKDYVSAKSAYQKCLPLAPPWRFRARYQLAQIELTEARRDEIKRQDLKLEESERTLLELAIRVKYDDAEKMLQENLAELRQAVQPDPLVQELTVYGLADIAYERSDYQTAEPRLKGALQEYPQSGLAARAHYRLALSVWRRANEEFKALNNPMLPAPQRERAQKQYLDSVAAASEQYAAVEAQLAKKPASVLTPDEIEMLTRSSFHFAALQIYAGKYNEALASFEVLAQKFAGRVEGLHAIHQIWQLQFHYLNQREKTLEQMERLRNAIEKMPDAIFDGSTEIHNKEYWIKKLVEMSKQS